MRIWFTGVGSLFKGYPLFVFLITEVRIMEELKVQVKRELIRTLFWAILAISVSIGSVKILF
jgi:hypothetical protein